ncbi:hypothetical protein HY642_07300 [Candidatus Woesearchaeota archaeon]|nr:hypothetical protein [Candidatus Woesearchaeota archaeon]
MLPIVRKDIVRVLSDTVRLLRSGKEAALLDLAELSNHVIHNATIYQDEDSITAAIAVYAIAKTCQRYAARQSRIPSFIPLLERARYFLSGNNDAKYREVMRALVKRVRASDERLGLYIEEVLSKAAIKKGQHMYEHGISVGRTAELLGISRWELLSYIGKTHIAMPETAGALRRRLEAARELFR